MNKPMHNSQYHVPVLLNEVLDYLKPASGKRFIDATLGGGGHTQAIAQQGATVLGIDQDQDAVDQSVTWCTQYSQVKVVRGTFEHLAALAKANGFDQVDGILFDLGVSSHQLDEGSRGFSFSHDAPLDMRMDFSLTVSAKDLVAALGENELTLLFQRYGEEPYARKIAKAIIAARKQEPITRTGQLAHIVETAVGGKQAKIHPATKVFQALRIAVNDEIEVLKNGLTEAISVTKPSGRIAVISFHSLEDRIVKHQFQEWEAAGMGRNVTHKPIEASESEQATNRRSRSAKLRIFVKN